MQVTAWTFCADSLEVPAECGSSFVVSVTFFTCTLDGSYVGTFNSATGVVMAGGGPSSRLHRGHVRRIGM